MNTVSGERRRGHQQDRSQVRLVPLLASLALLGMAQHASALEFELGPNAQLNLQTTLNYGYAVRTKSPDAGLLTNSSLLIAGVNRDDGDRNFRKWDAVNNRFTAIFDANLKLDGYGAFVRATAFNDFVYTGRNHNDSPSTNNNLVANGGALTDNQVFAKATRDRHGRDAEILDAYVYGDFVLANNPVTVRLGRQVVNWGESLFIIGGINTATANLDATKLSSPGKELKEVFLPTGQLYGQATFGNLTVAGYSQWEWDPIRLNQPGYFMSNNDALLGPSVLAFGAYATHGIDQRAKNTGQYGLSARYVAKELGSTEFGLYYVNYHDRLPALYSYADAASPIGLSYGLKYFENIKLYGASVSTVLGGSNYAAEISYRDGTPVEVNAGPDPFANYKRAKVVQAQMSAIFFLGTFGGLAHDSDIIVEYGVNRVLGLDNGELFVPSNSRTSHGGTIELELDYFNVGGLPLKMANTLDWSISPRGTSPTGAFAQKQNSLAIGTKFTYKDRYQFGISYTKFYGDKKDPKGNFDRDTLAVNAKISF